MRKYPARGRALFIFCPDFASLNKDGAFLRATSGGQLSRFSPMIFSKMARHLLLRVSRIPLLAVAMAGTVVLSAPLSLGAQENDKDLSVLGPGREEAATPNPFEVAQGYGRPPGDIGEPGDAPFAGEPPDGGNSSSGLGALKARCGRSTDRSNRCNSRPASSRSNSRNFKRMLISASTTAAQPPRPPSLRRSAARSTGSPALCR